MLIELLSLLFHIYWWMNWLKNDGTHSEMEDLFGKNA